MTDATVDFGGVRGSGFNDSFHWIERGFHRSVCVWVKRDGTACGGLWNLHEQGRPVKAVTVSRFFEDSHFPPVVIMEDIGDMLALYEHEVGTALELCFLFHGGFHRGVCVCVCEAGIEPACGLFRHFQIRFQHPRKSSSIRCQSSH